MPLPERRKTPEELAKLRESLGIPAEGAPEDAPGLKRGEPAELPDESESLKAAVFEAPDKSVRHDRPGQERETRDATAEEAGGELGRPKESMTGTVMPRETEKPSPHGPPPNLRKSASLPVDRPKPVRHREDGSLPVRRHTDEELMRLRRMDAAPMGAAVQDLARRTLSLPGMILFYLLAASAVTLLVIESLWLSRVTALDLPFDWLRSLVGRDWYQSGMMALIGGLSVWVLLIAGWIAWRRPLSRHHAGFLTIIAVLVLVFGILYFFPELHAA